MGMVVDFPYLNKKIPPENKKHCNSCTYSVL
jgi:hypothetical protein